MCLVLGVAKIAHNLGVVRMSLRLPNKKLPIADHDFEVRQWARGRSLEYGPGGGIEVPMMAGTFDFVVLGGVIHRTRKVSAFLFVSAEGTVVEVNEDERNARPLNGKGIGAPEWDVGGFADKCFTLDA